MTVPVTIAMPTYNAEEPVFRRVVDDALAGSPPDTQLVVVDMSTTDVVRRVCAENATRVRYEWLDSRGVSHSRNRCVELCETRYVAFLDSDAYPHAGWLEPLTEQLAGPDRVGVVGSRIVAAFRGTPNRLMRTATASVWLSLLDLGDQAVDIPTVIGTSYALDRERVPDPPFDESRGRRPGVAMAGEEVLLCRQVRASGWRVVYEPRSVVEHDIPAARAGWRWMWRRAYAAGQEDALWESAGDFPVPRFGPADHAFRAAMAPPFFAGRLRARLRGRA
jgi:cellulose synthase/poly-beta-1,6-N-acetylglucosamine synthase-like glycosyltransferase